MKPSTRILFAFSVYFTTCHGKVERPSVHVTSVGENAKCDVGHLAVIRNKGDGYGSLKGNVVQHLNRNKKTVKGPTEMN